MASSITVITEGWTDGFPIPGKFTVYALDVETLRLTGNFGGPEALAAIEGHILAQGSYGGGDL